MMKTKRIVTIIVLLLIACSSLLVGCDSTGGRKDSIYLVDYRHNGQFILPIAVTKADMPPDSIRHFKTKTTLKEMYDSLCQNNNWQTELFDDYILIKDLSESNLGYCIIYHKQVDNKFNYIACNMSCIFKSNESNVAQLEILVPMHFIPALIGNEIVVEEKEYDFISTKSEIVGFYSGYGFEIYDCNDGVIIKDTIGRTYGNISSFEDTINEFKITISDNKIVFSQI